MSLLTSLQLARYARHLPLLGEVGQANLLKAKILCVGAGGLGAPVLQYLAAAGVGTLGIVDGDQVELSNLQRQIIFTEQDIGKNKAEQAAAYLNKFNSELAIIVYPLFINQNNANQILFNYDIIIDATDNYRTRYLLNDVSFQLKKPLVSACIYQYYGQCSVFNYADGPCYRCLYESPPPPEAIPNCSSGGVLGVLPGLIGCIQATEAIKIILKQGDTLSGRLLTFDALNMQMQEFSIAKNPTCPCCQQGESATDLFATENTCSNVLNMTVSHLASKINSETLILIDVREDYEREICHIGGLHIPLAQLESQLDFLPKNKPIICYCKVGGRSYHAAQILLNNGFKSIYNLEGGILAWIREIDPTLTPY